MIPKNNFAIFKDGHKEEIIFFRDCPNEYIIFSTESGIYLYKPDPIKQYSDEKFHQPHYFYTIHLDFEDVGSYFAFPRMCFVEDPYIKEIKIDRSVLRTIDIPGFKCVDIFTSPDPTYEEIACAIIKELGVKFEVERKENKK